MPRLQGLTEKLTPEKCPWKMDIPILEYRE